MHKVKILVFDIETAPDLADVWGYWNNNVSLNQVRRDGWIMSFSAKWLGDDKVTYVENRNNTPDGDKELVGKLLEMIEEADMVVAHNGKSFDMGWFRAKAAIHGFNPPSPVKIIDTLIEARRLFKFPSYKLEYLVRRFKCAPKYPHKQFPGHELWVECMKGNPKAWKEMQTYNIGDTIALEQLYLKMRKWMPNHPNLGVYAEGDKPCCPACGSEKLVKRGHYHTELSKFQRYSCSSCGHWSRSRFNEYDKGKRRSLLTNAL